MPRVKLHGQTAHNSQLPDIDFNINLNEVYFVSFLIMVNSKAFIYKDFIIISGHILVTSDELDISALSRSVTTQFYCTL